MKLQKSSAMQDLYKITVLASGVRIHRYFVRSPRFKGYRIHQLGSLANSAEFGKVLAGGFYALIHRISDKACRNCAINRYSHEL